MQSFNQSGYFSCQEKVHPYRRNDVLCKMATDHSLSGTGRLSSNPTFSSSVDFESQFTCNHAGNL